MAIGSVPGSNPFNTIWKQTQARDLQSLASPKLNPQEFTGLANHWEKSRLLFDRLSAGGIDDNERQQLLDRVDGFQTLTKKYTEGDYQPKPLKDDPFQTPDAARKGLTLPPAAPARRTAGTR